MANQPIPEAFCSLCGKLTRETQSILGVMHYHCFKTAKIIFIGGVAYLDTEYVESYRTEQQMQGTIPEDKLELDLRAGGMK